MLDVLFEQMSRPTFIQIISIDILPVTRNITSTFDVSPGFCNSCTMFIGESPLNEIAIPKHSRLTQTCVTRLLSQPPRANFSTWTRWFSDGHGSPPFSASENHDCQRKTPGIDTQHPCICEKLLQKVPTPDLFFGIFWLDSLI